MITTIGDVARGRESPWMSVNLTTGVSTEVPAAGFGAPLFLTGALIVVEVVFFSTKRNEWIVLVRDHTTRQMPAGMREVSVDDLDLAARDALGLPRE